MPELPEVESQRRRVQRWLKGRRIAEVSVFADPVVYAGRSARTVSSAMTLSRDASIAGSLTLPGVVRSEIRYERVSAPQSPME